MNPRQSSGGTKNSDVASARCLFADFDGIDHNCHDRWIFLCYKKVKMNVRKIDDIAVIEVEGNLDAGALDSLMFR